MCLHVWPCLDFHVVLFNALQQLRPNTHPQAKLGTVAIATCGRIMNYAPDVFLGGVGNSVEESEIYGLPT